MSDTVHWPLRVWDPTDLMVGPCAWAGGMLLDHPAGSWRSIRQRPSLIVFGPDDDAESLRGYAEPLRALGGDASGSSSDGGGGWPIMLIMREPPFVRRLGDLVRQARADLGVDRIDVLTIWVEDLEDLKAGGALQVMAGLRDEGVVGYIGLGSDDVREAEWIAINTSARVLVLPYGLGDQSSRYRGLATAKEYGMVCVATGTVPQDERSLRFSLGEAESVLPVLGRSVPLDLTPMDRPQIDRCWEAYRSTHPAPEPLSRGRMPGS